VPRKPVLISKWDCVDESDREACLDFINKQINEAALGRQVDVIPIASRPGIGKKDEKLFGVKDLFPTWVKSVSRLLSASPEPVPQPKAMEAASLNRLGELV
jgi:hypothetical protein